MILRGAPSYGQHATRERSSQPCPRGLAAARFERRPGQTSNSPLFRQRRPTRRAPDRMPAPAQDTNGAIAHISCPRAPPRSTVSYAAYARATPHGCFAHWVWHRPILSRAPPTLVGRTAVAHTLRTEHPMPPSCCPPLCVPRDLKLPTYTLPPRLCLAANHRSVPTHRLHGIAPPGRYPSSSSRCGCRLPRRCSGTIGVWDSRATHRHIHDNLARTSGPLAWPQPTQCSTLRRPRQRTQNHMRKHAPADAHSFLLPSNS